MAEMTSERFLALRFDWEFSELSILQYQRRLFIIDTL
jgi:hypothetical protein